MRTGSITRRRFIQGGAALGAMSLGSGMFAPRAFAARAIKIGYVSPRTGPLAGFGDADSYVLEGVNAALKGGLKLGGQSYPVEILLRDSQSNPNRAAEVAKDLIVKDQIDLMVVASTPETTNPVSTQCEIEEIPCISTVAPWQPYFIGRQANPGDPKTWKPFESTFHFFWGLEDIISVYTNMWGQLQTNKSVGGLFPNDGDGNAWGDKVVGFPAPLAKLGYKLTDPGRFQDLTDDFSAQIAAFKQADCEIITGVVIPPDFTTFWNQANQRGFRPKAASIGKAILFPSAVEALGKTGNNLSSEVWWTPNHPFKSSLTGVSAADLAKGYEQASKRQWTQQIGFVHALFEVAVDALKRSADPTDPKANIQAIGQDGSVDDRRAHQVSARTLCRRSPATMSPRRLSSAVNGGSAATENTPSSLSTIRPPRKSPLGGKMEAIV